MNFKVGEKVVCIKKGVWKIIRGDESLWTFSNPIRDEIYVISGVRDRGFLELEGLSDLGAWHSREFRKLDYDFVESVLSMIKEDIFISN